MNHYLTDIEQAKLLATIKQYADEKAQRDYHICSALIHSGMRIGEFLLITVGDTLAALDSGSTVTRPAGSSKKASSTATSAMGSTCSTLIFS